MDRFALNRCYVILRGLHVQPSEYAHKTEKHVWIHSLYIAWTANYIWVHISAPQKPSNHVETG